MRHRDPRQERGQACGRLVCMATQRDHAAQTLRKAMPELQQRFGVVSVRIFGSVARDEAGPDSDVDILVEFARPVSLFVLADLRLFLTEALGRPVDVGTEASLRPRIREAVVAEAVRVA